MKKKTILCAMCNQAKVQGQWMTEEKALQLLGIGEDEVVTDFNHGICPPCMDSWHAAEASAKAKNSFSTAA